MSFGGVVGGILKGQVKRRSRFALALATASIGFRVFKRVTRLNNAPAIRFEVKPGEIYQLRGIRRGR